MGTHPIFESDFDCLTVQKREIKSSERVETIEIGQNRHNLEIWSQS